MEPWAFITSALGMFLIGLALALVGWNYIPNRLSVKTKRASKFFGVILVVAAIATYSGISIFGEDTSAPASSVGTFVVNGSEAESHVTLDQVAKKFVVAATFDTSDADFTDNTGLFNVTFTVQRGLGTVGLVQTYGDVSSIPSVSDTTGTAYPVIAKSSDQYSATWTRADDTTANKMVTLTIAEDADGVEVSLQIQLNAEAFAQMDQYDTETIGITIGGENWSIVCLLASVQA
jgi:hypothetical protein